MTPTIRGQVIEEKSHTKISRWDFVNQKKKKSKRIYVGEEKLTNYWHKSAIVGVVCLQAELRSREKGSWKDGVSRKTIIC